MFTRRSISCVALSAVCVLGAVGGVGCTADIHDNVVNVEDAKVSFSTSIDVDNVEPGAAVPVTIEAENVFLIAPEEEPPAEHVDDACHLRFFLDDDGGAPLLITASTSASVSVPADASEGPHLMICRVYKHDGTPTSATFFIKINVKVKISG